MLSEELAIWCWWWWWWCRRQWRRRRWWRWYTTHTASYHHDEEYQQDAAERLDGCAVDGCGQLVDAACLVDGQVLGRIVSEVTRAVSHVDLDARSRRQNITAAERNAVRQQETALHLPSTSATDVTSASNCIVAKHYDVYSSIHRAGLTIVPFVPWEGPPPPGDPRATANFFYHAILTFETFERSV